MSKSNNWVYFGIDQTGAIDRNGIPKPLPACIIEKQNVRFFYLKSLNLQEIKKHVSADNLKNVLICVDCVFGLPLELNKSWPEAMELLQEFKNYGRQPAQDYFRALGDEKILLRQVEVLCNANSVFKEKPFQKNIQTGTYRIWKDLLLNKNNFYVPALKAREHKDQLPLFEGYPSYSWKLILDSSQRRPNEISKLLKKFKIKLNWNSTLQREVTKDPNLADALLLALTISKYRAQGLKQKPHPEGWILGANIKNYDKRSI